MNPDNQDDSYCYLLKTPHHTLQEMHQVQHFLWSGYRHNYFSLPPTLLSPSSTPPWDL